MSIGKLESEFGFSVPAQEMKLRFLVEKSQIEFQLGDLGSFRASIERINSQLDRLVNDFSDNDFLLLQSARWTSVIARAVLFNEYESQEAFQDHFWLAVNCLTTSQNILEAIREESPVNQAIALRECLVMNLVAIAKDWINSDNEASTYRLKRDRILSNLLSRDPKNDLAIRLKKEYEETSLDSHPQMWSDVEKWDWQISPLKS